MSIGRTPLGFGSSSSRFPKEKKDSTPGPGCYDPKSPSTKVEGGSFSKAERFPSKHDAVIRHQLGLESTDVDRMPSNTLIPIDESYQHLSDLREQYRQEHKWQKKSLEDGRKVMILGGLERDVQIFNRLSQESSDSHMSGLNKMHEELLGEVTKELKMLVGNIDLETDGFALKEVEVVQSLFKILEDAQIQLQNHGLGREQSEMEEAAQLLTQLDGQYTNDKDSVQVQFDGTAESLERMAKALSSTDNVEIFDKKFETVQQTMTKAQFLQNKQFYIKRPPPETPCYEQFEALFPESNPNVHYE